METFKLKVITPVGVVLEEDLVNSVYLNSSEGEIGILPEHVLYSGLLGTGFLRYNTTNNKQNKISISGGFCNFSKNELLILADKAELEL